MKKLSLAIKLDRLIDSVLETVKVSLFSFNNANQFDGGNGLNAE